MYNERCFHQPFFYFCTLYQTVVKELFLQKNADAIRRPEEEKEPEVYGLDVRVDTATARVISPSIAAECADAGDNIFSNETYLSAVLSREFVDI